jgi:hypothetical protein
LRRRDQDLHAAAELGQLGAAPAQRHGHLDDDPLAAAI